LLVADFGGGTSDFSVVRVDAPGAARRCTALGHAGIGIAGDRFDYRIIDQLVLPMLGKGGNYRSFDKILEIPGGYFADFGDWSRLALMRNRRTLEALHKLQRSAEEPAAIGRMIAIIENELGYRLYDAVGKLKRALSGVAQAEFRFDGGGVKIATDVRREQFEAWIAPDLARIEATVDQALAVVGRGRGRDRPGVPDRRIVADPGGARDLRAALRRGADRQRRRADLDRAWAGDGGAGRGYRRLGELRSQILPLAGGGLRAQRHLSADWAPSPSLTGVWMPHSVLSKPRQRPARGSSPGLTTLVHGAQPIER
jgi:hypothetical protein